jgi:hypothetical protein
VSASDTADLGYRQASQGPLPLLRLRCTGCGYGASVRKTPTRCPMCSGSTWVSEGWRPWGDLIRDLDPAADAALTRDDESGVSPGVPAI